MKTGGCLVFLGLLGVCLGQGYGGMHSGGEVVWTDDYTLDTMGSSPIIVTSDSGHLDHSFFRELPATTPAPLWGIGGTFGTVTDTEADLSGTKSVQMLYVGYPLKLTCNLTSHENTSFKLDWFKDEMKIESNARTKIFQENSSLLIPSPVKEDVGLYKCQTQRGIPNDKPLNMFFNVIYFEMRKMDKSVNVDMEKSIKLECPVEGQPYPVITWKKDDMPIAELINATRITYSPNDKKVPNGTILITNAGWTDRGNYTCVITTLSNTFERFTFIRVKDVYAALWPFIGIVVEVLLLGIIIFIFEKRRAKAEFEESDTDQGNDQKNTADLNKDSVRQRK
ncbi:neuroplastin [Cherax quadricarinatus]|nr:neuroplastin-like [Cherax quadricarinatus]